MSQPKEILVTGASRGIGRAICRKALEMGLRITGIARNPGDGMGSEDAFRAVSMDLADVGRLPQALRQLRATLPPIDAVVFNAGRGRFGHIEQFSPQQIRQLIDLNLTGQMLLARAFIPAMKARGMGNLIFIGSEAALHGGKRGAVYCATKFALRGFAQALREECAGTGIRVGIVNPGMVRSNFYDELDFRPGEAPENHLTPEDVAEAVWLMLSARKGAVIDEINLTPQKRVIQFGAPD